MLLRSVEIDCNVILFCECRDGSGAAQQFEALARQYPKLEVIKYDGPKNGFQNAAVTVIRHSSRILLALGGRQASTLQGPIDLVMFGIADEPPRASARVPHEIYLAPALDAAVLVTEFPAGMSMVLHYPAFSPVLSRKVLCCSHSLSFARGFLNGTNCGQEMPGVHINDDFVDTGSDVQEMQQSQVTAV